MSASDHEVIAPGVSTGMEQRRHGARIGIDACEVWSFIRVAAVTGERETAGMVGATVLPRYNMFNMERN